VPEEGLESLRDVEDVGIHRMPRDIDRRRLKTVTAIPLALLALSALAAPVSAEKLVETRTSAQGSAEPSSFRVAARPSRLVTTPRGVIQVTGEVRPRASRQRVLLQARVDGRWSTVAGSRLSRHSTFTLPFRARGPGGQLLRVVKPRSDDRSAGASRVIHVVAMARRTVRSSGGELRLGLGPVRVIAPEGAIRKGKTLTISTAPPQGPPGFPSTAGGSLAGGPYVVSTSQGKPARPVTVKLRYERGSLSEAGSPLVLHGWEKLGDWVPEKTTSNARVVSATLDSFSPLDVVDDVTWWAGRITGNRTELPGNCGEVPSWITGASFPRGRNEALPSCISNRTDAGALRVNIVNNRGYAQLVTVTGARVAAERSGSWSSSVDKIITDELARRNPANRPSSFVLGPGASATIALDRPLDLVGQRSVVIRGAPRGGSAVAQLAWTLVSAIEKVKEKVAVPRSVTNCITGVLYNSTSAAASAESSISSLRSCLEAGAGLKGIAKEALKKIGSAVLVTDVFHKVVDLHGDEAFPPRIEFIFQGASRNNPDIELGNLDVGTVPAGKTTTWRLTARGGSPPYAFAISTISKNIGRVPDWVSLDSGGTLSISPPAGTSEYVTFSVFATDATGRRSATGIYEVTFTVEAIGAKEPPAGSFKSVSANDGNACGVRPDDSLACWGEYVALGMPSGTFKSVSVGYGHACAVRIDDSLACWGWVTWSWEGGTDVPAPPPPSGAFKSVSAGDSAYSCGIRADDSVTCWGIDLHDEYPSLPTPSGSFKSVAAGDDYACGVRTDDSLECWGIDWNGVVSSRPSGSFRSVSVSDYSHGCAVKLDDSLACWGTNFDGQASPPSGAFKSVSAGVAYSCGIKSDDTIECWGSNEFGQASPPGGPFKSVSAGRAYACGIRGDDTIACWGT